ncbi:LysR family transcriptional regulator [Enterococcus sp. LJL120]
MLSPAVQVFLTVAKEGSFSKAAQKLFITSTAVMKQINNLEAQLGFALFTRTNQGVLLTDAGESLNKDCLSLQKTAKEALQKARKLSDTTAIIRLGTASLSPGKPLIDLWNSSYGNFPDFQLNVVPFNENHTQILTVLDNLGTDFDLFVSPCDAKSWLEHANFLQLGNYSVEMALPRNHPLASKKMLEPTDFSGKTIIIFKEGESDTLDQVRRLLQEKNTNITIESTDFYDIDTFNYCIKNNYSLLTLDGWQDIHPAFKTVPVKWNFQIPYGILYAKQPAPLVEDFIEIVTAIQTSQP